MGNCNKGRTSGRNLTLATGITEQLNQTILLLHLTISLPPGIISSDTRTLSAWEIGKEGTKKVKKVLLIYINNGVLIKSVLYHQISL